MALVLSLFGLVNSNLTTVSNNFNSFSSVSDGTVTPTSYVVDGTFYVKKIGNVVHFTSATGINLTGTASSGQTIFTIANGFRPSTTLRVPCGVIIGGTYTFRELSINTNGSCELQGSSAGTATRLVFAASFYAA